MTCIASHEARRGEATRVAGRTSTTARLGETRANKVAPWRRDLRGSVGVEPGSLQRRAISVRKRPARSD